MAIDTLIFDFDGVIIDTETPDFQTWQEVFHAHGVEFEMGWWTQFIGGSVEVSEIFQKLEDRSGSPVDRSQLREHKRNRYLEIVRGNPLLPGVLDYIREAKQLGLKLGVASSSFRSWVEGNLENRGLLKYFDAIAAADDVAHVKPNPELYLRVISQLGARPENCLAIEDSANGVTAAKQAGIYCIAVPNPMTKDLALDHADLRLESLSEMSLQTLLRAISGNDRSMPKG